MQFQPGVPRHPNAGRRKGTPNKKAGLGKRLSRAGVSVEAELVKAVQSGNAALISALLSLNATIHSNSEVT